MMYSAILMMALTTGGQTADRGHHGGCCGESSCCGYSGGCGYGGCGYSGGCGYGYGGCGYSGGCGYGYGGCGYSGGYGCSSCGYAFSGYYGSGYVAANEAPATLIVSLPADAKLMIDDTATTSTSAQRVFVSPNLPTGKEYHYTLKAEMTTNGKPIVFSQDVTVKAGESTRVTLTPPSGVASR